MSFCSQEEFVLDKERTGTYVGVSGIFIVVQDDRAESRDLARPPQRQSSGRFYTSVCCTP
jgi:hypothetical protein